MKRYRFILLLSVLVAASLLLPSFAFSDDSRIGAAYSQVVREMSSMGVLSGFPDGTFRPEGTLTREQGAKIIAYMILGNSIDTLTCVSDPFNDVSADRWSAPCIKWCVDKNILLGYGGGLYGPEDKLTGDQFAKMLLCALDLARPGNYAGLGENWYRAVRDDGSLNYIYKGDSGMATDQPISRQQASLLAWNAMSAAKTKPSQTQASSGSSQTPSNPSSSLVSSPNSPDVPVMPSTPAESDQGSSVIFVPPYAGSGNEATLPEIEVGGNDGSHNGNSGTSDQSHGSGGESGQGSSGSSDQQTSELPAGSGGNGGNGGSGNNSGVIVLPELP